METFNRNLDIVLEFATRVELYDDRTPVVESLRTLCLKDARAGCRRALLACQRDLQARGLSSHDIIRAPSYRRLLQLDEMIADLTDSLDRKTGIKPTGTQGGIARACPASEMRPSTA